MPFDERRCRDLITLYSLHIYYGGPEPTPAARRLHAYSRRRKLYSFLFPIVFICVCLSNIRLLSFAKLEATRQRALVRAAATSKKKKEKDGASSSAPKDVTKGTSKRKSDGKDDRLLKKGPGIPASDKKPKQLSPPKPSHEDGKGLMTETGLVTQGIRCLITHKGYAVEMVESIIKEMDVDLCVEQETEDLGASSLFDLSKVCSSPRQFYFIVYSSAEGCVPFLGFGTHEGAPRQVRR